MARPQHKTHARFEALIKAIGDGTTVRIDGFASTPDPDRGQDIVLPEAFADTLKEYMANPVLLWDHGMDENYGYMPIGQVTSATVETGGLHITAEITDPVIAQKVSRGELRTLSFGYEIPEGEVDWTESDGKYLRIIKKVTLYEISVVAIPMNPSAMFSMAKSFKSYLAGIKKLDGQKAGSDAHDSDAPAVQSEAPVTPPTMDETKKDETVAADEKAAERTVECKTCGQKTCPCDLTKGCECKADCHCGTKSEDSAEAPVETPAETKEEAPVAETPAEEAPEASDNAVPAGAAEETPATDTPEGTPPEEKSVQETETPVIAPTETKGADEDPSHPSPEVETKSLTDTETLTKGVADLSGEVKSLSDFKAKAEEALNLIVDRLVAVEAKAASTEKSVKSIPVNQPFAVTQFPLKAQPKRKSALENLLSVSAE